MAVLISNGDTTLSTANGFYDVEAYNLGWDASTISLGTTRYINLTFTSSGEFLGVVLHFWTTSMTSREAVVNLQENVSGTWTTRTSMTLSTTDITGNASTGRRNEFLGQYITPITFTTPYTIDTTASKWRLEIAHGSGTGTWNIKSVSTGHYWHAVWTNVQKTFADNDVIVCKDKVVVDKTATIGAVIGTDTANGVGMVLCSNPVDPTEENIVKLDWENPPLASYKLTIRGQVIVGSYSGFRVGKEDITFSNVDISIASPCVVTSDNHGLTNGKVVSFSSTGALPTGITANTKYYVVNASTNTFNIEATIGGGAINTSGTQSGVHTCINHNRIPVNKKAIIEWGTAAAGTIVPSFRTVTSNSATSSSTHCGRGSLLLYGEIPTWEKTNLSADAAINQKVIYTKDITDWQPGDEIVVGKGIAKSQGATTIHVIDSISGDEIIFTANLATTNRKGPTTGDSLGGTVLKLGSHGITMGVSSTNIPIHYLGLPCFLKMSGVDFYNQRFMTAQGTTWAHLYIGTRPEFTDTYYIGNCTAISNIATVIYLFQGFAPPKGMLIEKLYCFRCSPASTLTSLSSSGFKSGEIVIKDSVIIGNFTSTISTASNIKLQIRNCRFENTTVSTYNYSITGINSRFVENYVWGCGSLETAGAVNIGFAINPLSIRDNTYENNTCALCFGSATNANCLDIRSKFVDNTIDISFTDGASPDYVFQDPISDNIVIDETFLPEITVGTRVGFVNFNNITGEDLTIYSTGKIRKTGPGLSDETTRTAGGYAMRFFPSSDTEPFEFAFNVPTGDIKDKAMGINIRCKIKNEAYWAGEYVLPKLTVIYDNGDGEIIYITEKTTDWQLLSVTFVPETSAGNIRVILSGMTDAEDDDAFFYWDDSSVLYPAGYNLNLGGFDIWDKALPVLPPIAIVSSAADTWAYPTRTLTSLDINPQQIWEYTTRTLTESSTITPQEVWEYTERKLTAAGIAEIQEGLAKTSDINNSYLGNKCLEVTYCEEVPTPNPRNLFIGCEDYLTEKVKRDGDSDWSSPISEKVLYYWYDEEKRPIKSSGDDS